MATIIAILNYKGGCAKTTTAINLGAALNLLGKKVLLVDLDFQCNATHHLGFKPSMGETIYDLFTRTDLEEMPLYEFKKDLDYIPSSYLMKGIEPVIVNKLNREKMLRKMLSTVTPLYDYIIIDCPPNGGLLNVNAMAAANKVIIPVECEPYAVQGVPGVLESINDVKSSEVNTDLEVMGFLLTKYDMRLSVHKEVARAMKEKYGNVYNAKIRLNSALKKCSGFKQTIFDYDIKSNGASDYAQLAREITGSKKKIV